MNKILRSEPVSCEDDCTFCNNITAHKMYFIEYIPKVHKVKIMYSCDWCMENLPEPQVTLFILKAEDWVDIVKDSNYGDEN